MDHSIYVVSYRARHAKFSLAGQRCTEKGMSESGIAIWPYGFPRAHLPIVGRRESIILLSAYAYVSGNGESHLRTALPRIVIP